MDPRYPKARYGLPLLNNIKSLLQANEEEFLAWANRDENDVPQAGMTPYGENYFTARFIRSNFPNLTIVLRRSHFEEHADGVAIKQDHEINIIIECAGADADSIGLDCFKRCAAVDGIIRSASNDQLYAGYAINHLKHPYFEVSDWDFIELMSRVTSAYHRRATLIVKFFDLWETK